MKNKLFILGLFVFAGLMTSCDHNSPNSDKFDANPSDGYVEFEETQSFAGNDMDFAKVPLLLEAPVNEDGLDVTVSANAGGTNIGPLTGHFAPDSLTGHVNVPLESNMGDYKVDLALSSTSKGGVEIGLDSLSIVENELYVCQGGAIGTFSGAGDIDGEPVNEYETSIAVSGFEDGHCIYTSENIWGDNFVQEAAGDPEAPVIPYDVTFVINDDNSIIVSSSTQPGGTGTYDPETNTIELMLEQQVFTGDFLVHVVLEKQ